MNTKIKGNFDNLVVVKRSGQRTEFNGEKIALAIKKAFDTLDHGYSPEAINKTYEKILKIIEIRYKDRKTIKIEDIQDIIEEELKNSRFDDVYEAFKTYREQRAISRETFVIKQQHKFLKAIETLGLNSYDLHESKSLMDTKSSIEVLETFGETIAEEFAKAYLLDNKYVRMQDSGLFAMANLSFLPMGTTSSMQWDLERIWKLDTINGNKEELLPCITEIYYLLQSNIKDQYGAQSIESFDHFLAPIILNTFIQKWRSILKEFLDVGGFLEFFSFNKMESEIEKLEHIPDDIDYFCLPYKNTPVFSSLLKKSYLFSLEETKKEMKKAFDFFIESLTTPNISTPFSISLGTNISVEGKLIITLFLDCLRKKQKKYPICFLKLKKGINLKKEDPGYEAIEKELRNPFPTLKFIFLDTSYNQRVYESNNYTKEVGYFPDGERVCDDITPGEAQTTGGKGVLSYSYLNLPRIALKYMTIAKKETRLKEFYSDLEQLLDIVCDATLERFEIQCSKHSFNFPFLIQKGIWLDGEKVKETDRLRKILKHGTLSIRFIGLNEAVYALIEKNLSDNEGAEIGSSIVSFMRKKLDEISQKSNLNFVLSGIGNSFYQKQFIQIDKAIYGKIKGVTDKDEYTESFHIWIKEDPLKTIIREEKFHKLTNGGHMTEVSLPKEEKDILFLIEQASNTNIGVLSFSTQKNSK